MKNLRIAVLGASGFIGSNVLEYLSELEFDVFGVGTKPNPWRIKFSGDCKYLCTANRDMIEVLNTIEPNIIINFIAHGAYSFQNDIEKITYSNFLLLDKICNWALEKNAFIIHAGTSSEYGLNCAGPEENGLTLPNSVYAVTKLAGTHLISNYAKFGLSAIVLRLYSVYGPKEDTSRLMPAVMRGILKNEWPKFTDLEVSRDFIYTEDVNTLLFKIIEYYSLNLKHKFEIFNVGYGKEIKLFDLVNILKNEFGMPNLPKEIFKRRDWDVSNWYSNNLKVIKYYDWLPVFDLSKGLHKLKNWYLQKDNVKYLGNEYSELVQKND